MLTGNEMISEKTEDQMAIEIDKFDFHKAHCITWIFFDGKKTFK